MAVDHKVAKGQAEVNENLYSLYQKLFSKNDDISRLNVLQYLQDKNLPKLNEDQLTLREKDITEKYVKHELNKMENNKSPV